jgi:CheY-like chemotaxis protein
MDGFQSIRILRQNAPKIAIIAVSGYAFREASWPVPDFLKMACELGATCCLPKPIKAGELIKAVETSCAVPLSKHEAARKAAQKATRGPGVFVPDCADPCPQA